MENKVKVYVVSYSSDEGFGIESVHKTLQGAEARILKVKEEGMDSCTYEIDEMTLMP